MDSENVDELAAFGEVLWKRTQSAFQVTQRKNRTDRRLYRKVDGVVEVSLVIQQRCEIPSLSNNPHHWESIAIDVLLSNWRSIRVFPPTDHFRDLALLVESLRSVQPFEDIAKSNRTIVEDVFAPIALGQRWSTWLTRLRV